MNNAFVVLLHPYYNVGKFLLPSFPPSGVGKKKGKVEEVRIYE